MWLHCGYNISINEAAEYVLLMTYMRYICPICKAEMQNPEELRQHRLKEHKTVLSEIKLGQ
jgi:hypothetical protein